MTLPHQEATTLIKVYHGIFFFHMPYHISVLYNAFQCFFCYKDIYGIQSVLDHETLCSETWLNGHLGTKVNPLFRSYFYSLDSIDLNFKDRHY